MSSLERHGSARAPLALSLPTLAALALIALPGCPSRSLSEVPMAQDVVQRTSLKLDDNRDIDILFVIDSSSSMVNEQISLGEEFPKIIDALTTDGELPSVHLGVITTDVGGGELCPGDGDDGRLQLGTECNAINDGGTFIADIANEDGSRTTNYDGALRDAFSCLARVGTEGCGFEAPLESLKRAIDHPDNAGFFREDAYLAVVFVTDEDDCSILGPAMLDDTGDQTRAVLDSTLGPSSSFRCFEFGVVCDGPADPRELGARTDCRPRSGSPYMNDVAPYIEHLRASKKFPSQIFVAGIAGDLEPVAVELADANGYSFQVPSLAYSCSGTGLGEAFPPVRLDAFLNGFEANTLVTLCQDDLTGAVSEIADFIGQFNGPPCLKGNLSDTSDEPGVQPDCSIVEVTNPGIDGEIERLLPACDNPGDPPGSSELPCFHMYEAPVDCSDHPSLLALEVVYPDGFTVPPATRAEVSCVSVPPVPQPN